MKASQAIEYSEATQAIDLIPEKALKMKKSVVIAVADSHSELIAFARMDGAPISSIRIAVNKAWTAARERKPIKEIGDKVRHPEKGHDIAYYGDPSFVGCRRRRHSYLEGWGSCGRHRNQRAIVD